MSPALFSEVPCGPPDPMFVLKQASDGDTSPDKIDIGIGVYRSEKPGYHEFQAVNQAKRVIDSQPANHEYNPTTGIQSFLDVAAELVFGEQHAVLQNKMVASIQTVGGTGAVRLGAAFLNRNFPVHSPTARLPNPTKVFVGTPAWPNYIPLFAHAGFKVETFRHYDPDTKSIDLQAALTAIKSAPPRSIFILQICCHNPTGQDYTRDQWHALATALKTNSHFVFCDLAYQGFARDMETDAWPIRYLVDQGIDTLVCQSFSKHMGLYSERVGVLHIPCSSAAIATNVRDQLRSIVRWEVSSTPAYGARIADIILRDPKTRTLWLSEVKQACDRMVAVRYALHDLLVNKYRVHGAWGHILQETGLFSYMKLTSKQIERLRIDHHVHLAPSGRINVAGLNWFNVERFAKAVKDVVDGEQDSSSSTLVVRDSRL